MSRWPSIVSSVPDSSTAREYTRKQSSHAATFNWPETVGVWHSFARTVASRIAACQSSPSSSLFRWPSSTLFLAMP